MPWNEISTSWFSNLPLTFNLPFLLFFLVFFCSSFSLRAFSRSPGNSYEWKLFLYSHNFHNFPKWEENFIVHVKDWEINHRRRGEFYPLWFFFHSLCRYQIVDGIWQKNIFIYISYCSTVPRQNESPQITALTTRSQQRYFNL